MRSVLCALAVLLNIFSPAQACDTKPDVTFAERPYDPADLDGGKVELLVVNGKPWKHSYWKSALFGIPMQDVLPDCRVIIVGRKGLAFHVVIEDQEWQHAVYNSASVFFKDGRVIAHVGERDFVVNDVAYPMAGKLKKARFTENGDLEVTWEKADHREVMQVFTGRSQ